VEQQLADSEAVAAHESDGKRLTFSQARNGLRLRRGSGRVLNAPATLPSGVCDAVIDQPFLAEEGHPAAPTHSAKDKNRTARTVRVASGVRVPAGIGHHTRSGRRPSDSQTMSVLSAF
jgi:hypothetical protein